MFVALLFSIFSAYLELTSGAKIRLYLSSQTFLSGGSRLQSLMGILMAFTASDDAAHDFGTKNDTTSSRINPYSVVPVGLGNNDALKI
jgi:hypothetical protein